MHLLCNSRIVLSVMFISILLSLVLFITVLHVYFFHGKFTIFTTTEDSLDENELGGENSQDSSPPNKDNNRTGETTLWKFPRYFPKIFPPVIYTTYGTSE